MDELLKIESTRKFENDQKANIGEILRIYENEKKKQLKKNRRKVHWKKMKKTN